MINNKLPNNLKINKIFFTILIIGFIVSCKSTNSKTNLEATDYSKKTENFFIKKGKAIFDLNDKNIKTYQIENGNNIIFIYERTGTTILDGEDWDLKYQETLIFQIDSSLTNFNYCDNDLKNIDCKYFWICYSKDIKKEVREIKKGCIQGLMSKDSINVDIDINTNFGFGSFMDKNDKRRIKIKEKTRR